MEAMTLTREQHAELTKHEAAIRKHLPSIAVLGFHLREIRDKKLFAGKGYATMKDYVAKEFNLTKQICHHYMSASEIREDLGIPAIPASSKDFRSVVELALDGARESVYRAVKSVPKERRQEVIEQAYEASGDGNVTGEDIRRAAAAEPADVDEVVTDAEKKKEEEGVNEDEMARAAVRSTGNAFREAIDEMRHFGHLADDVDSVIASIDYALTMFGNE